MFKNGCIFWSMFPVKKRYFFKKSIRANPFDYLLKIYLSFILKVENVRYKEWNS